MLANLVFVPVSLSKGEDAELIEEQYDEKDDNTYSPKGENLGGRRMNIFFFFLWKERPAPNVLTKLKIFLLFFKSVYWLEKQHKET